MPDSKAKNRCCRLLRTAAALARWRAFSSRPLQLLVLILAVRCAGTSSGCVPSPRPRFPMLDGDHAPRAGFSAPVTVRRDQHGVPHIDAATQEDLFVAQGYVTAQDRLWQMDVIRRSANGELAEVMGRSLCATTWRSASSSFATLLTASMPTCRRRPRPPRSLCARRESLHRSAFRIRFRRSSPCSTTSRSRGPAQTPSASA